MRTFTVRDLDRKPGEVLDTCEKEGVVQIRRRNGRTYTLKTDGPGKPKMAFSEWLKDIDRRRRRLFPRPIMTAKEASEFDRLLSSEGRLL
jgi:hypothetical protein